MMSKLTKSTKEMNREEWLAERQKGIGGSDAAAIVGMNPYSSAIHVWMDKLGKAEELEDNDYMRAGRDLEPYVVSRWEEITGKKARRKNSIMVHDKYKFMLANVDRMVNHENAGLEIKTASPYSSEQWKDGKVPPQYEIQCHHYMAVTGAERWYLCGFIYPHIETRVIERDEEVIASIEYLEKEFWEDYVLTEKMPPPDGSESAKESLLNLYPEAIEGAEIELYEKDKMKRYFAIEELEKELKREKEGIKQELQALMQEVETAFVGPHKVTWKKGKKSRIFRVKKGE